MEKQQYFLGVDVSKATLDIAVVKEGEVVLENKIANENRAISKFINEARKSLSISADQMTFCLEHTGIYGLHLLHVLDKAKIRICVEPALQIKQSQGMTRGKNDQVDARRIAQYAFKNRLELRYWKPQRVVLQKLQALLSLRDRLIKVKVQLEVPIEELTGFLEEDIAKSVASLNKATIKGLEKDLKEVEKEKLKSKIPPGEDEFSMATNQVQDEKPVKEQPQAKETKTESETKPEDEKQ